MIEHARLLPGPGFRPLRAVLFYTQRAVGDPGWRSAVVSAIAFWQRRRGTPAFGWAGEPRAREIAALGFARLGAVLSAVQLDEIRRHLAEKPLFHFNDPKRQIPPG